MLNLDARQRAMLQEMGLRTWVAPETATDRTPVANPGRMPARAGLAATTGATAVPTGPTVARHAPEFVAISARSISDTANITSQTVVATAPHTAINSEATTWSVLDWPALQTAVLGCRACGLCEGRKSVVSGAWPKPDPPNNALSNAVNVQPKSALPVIDWMIVTDPPDEDEERAGVAGVGDAGRLLDNMLKAVGARRVEVALEAPAEPPNAGRAMAVHRPHKLAFVTPAAKCRPASARQATAADLAQCEPILRQQVALLQPRVIVAMGRMAVHSLLASSAPELVAQPLGKLRGQVHRYQGVPVVITYPPKTLLRSPSDKAKAWADLQLAMRQLPS